MTNRRLKQGLAAGVFSTLLIPSVQASSNAIRSEEIVFAKGRQDATLSGAIGGYQVVDYLLRASAGQTLTVDRKSGKLAAYFNLRLPGSNDAAMLDGATSGNRFELAATDHGSLSQRFLCAQQAHGKAVTFGQAINGKLTGAEVADLNMDGQPERYVYTQSAGSGSYAGQVSLVAQQDGKLVPVRRPDRAKDAKASRGYTGHDAFAVAKNR